MYVLLTISLRQIGSAESKKLNEKEEVDREPSPNPKAPWAVKKGGWILNSIAIPYLSVCPLNICPRTTFGLTSNNQNFWFETFQNWQSEFLSVAAIVFFTIYLRQKGSPESKPVDAPHMETGK